MKKINKKQTGLSLGILFGLMHLVWLLALIIGWAESWVNLMLRYHFVSKAYQIESFNLGTGIVGLGGALLCGYVTGWIFAYIWNWSGEKV